MVFALLIAAGVADSEYWRTVNSYGDVSILQHESGYRFIARNMQPDDKVVTVSPMSAAIVLGSLDYYLMESLSFDEIYLSKEQGIIDRWSGGHLVSNVERLRNVFLENERVWVMMNIQETPKLSTELVDYVYSVTQPQLAFFGGEVLLWDRSKGLQESVANRNRGNVSF